MLRVFSRVGDQLAQSSGLVEEPGKQIIWIDLFSPSPQEGKEVEAFLGLVIPTLDEMKEIEFSSRLYFEDDAEFMTFTLLHALDTEDVQKTPITFILKRNVLVTVRYAEPKPFMAFLMRAQRNHTVGYETGEGVMLGLIEAVVDRVADALERISTEVDGLSHQVFRNGATRANKKTNDLESVISQIGIKSDLVTMIQESLVSITRLAAYHSAAAGPERKGAKDPNRQRTKLVERDTASLREHATFLSSKLTVLLDATLGMISVEQNKIIKIFSVAAVVFLPPTLIASIYGMNFHLIPELSWEFGYPFAIGLMILSAILPYLYFKTKGWL
ncbi:magnesium transporter CorA family protein [Devosia sp.]|uniref:magnesium transporter CorA family protein n=1 Tax=Devosia sp. TaxID=1871048 RepID=UPI003BA85140